MELLAHIKTEWAVISQAPFTFLVLAGLIYGVLHVAFRKRLGAAKELIDLRDKQIDDFKAKIGVESLDDAAIRLKALEDRFQKLDDVDLVSVYENAKLDISKLPEAP